MKKIGVVDICGIDYDVEEVTVEEDNNLGDCYAYVVHKLSLIRIQSGLGPTCFRNVLLHEIQHGIWEHSGIKQLDAASDKYEEAFICMFTIHWIAAQASMRKWKIR